MVTGEHLPLDDVQDENGLYERMQDRFSDAADQLHEVSDRLHDKSDTALRVIKHQRPPDGKSDWSDVPHHKRKLVQKIAAATGGVVAPATPLTGYGHYKSGCAIISVVRGNFVQAAQEAFEGRVPDIGDGFLADITGTKSPFGAGLDAGGDALVMSGLFSALAWQGKIPPDVAGVLLYQRIRTVYENVRIRALGGDTNPTMNGKNAMFKASLYVGGILKREAHAQQGNTLRSKAYGAAATVMGELAMQKGAAALSEYRTRRLALEAATNQSS